MQLMVQMEIRVTKSLRKVANKDGRNHEEMEWKVISTLNIQQILFCLQINQIIINYKYTYKMIISFRKNAIIHARSQIL